MPLAIRQVANRRCQIEESLALGLLSLNQVFECFGVAEFEAGTAELRTKRARAHVRGNLKQPRPRIVRLETSFEASPGIQIGRLNRVLGFLGRPQSSEAVAIDR